MSFKSRLAPFSTYSIGQLSREFGTTTRALRFYEEQGLLFPRRREAERIYSYKDRARLALIMRGRRVGLSVAEIRQILDLYEEKGEAAQNAQALQIFRRRIDALEAQRREVDDAIGALQQAARRLSEHPAVALERLG